MTSITKMYRTMNIKLRKANWIGHIVRRNCLLKHIMEGKIEVRRVGRKDVKEDVNSSGMILRKRKGTGN